MYKTRPETDLCLSVCVGHTGELCKNGWTDQDAVWGLTHMDPMNHISLLDGAPDPPTGWGTFEEDMCPAHGNAYTHKCTVYCSPATAGEWTNAFAAVMSDKTAMRPSVKILCKLVVPDIFAR